MTDVAKVSIEQGESTPNHWAGACGDLVMLFAYEGSSSDTAHVLAAARQLERSMRRGQTPVSFLCALPPWHARPPDESVRRAILQTVPRFDGRLSRVSVLVTGSGFGSALHRGAITGLMAVLRPKTPMKVHASVDEALHFLLGPGHPAMAELRAHCEARLAVRGT